MNAAITTRFAKVFAIVSVTTTVAVSTQTPAIQRNMSLALARAIADATYSECASKGFHTAVVVVDRSGQLMMMLRDDQASPVTFEMARRKAYTAVMFRQTTLDFQKRTADDPNSAPMRSLTDMLPLGGGVPVRSGNEVIGAVASSGSSQPMDDACAKAVVAKVADQLK